jgi:hypothetical protein
MICASAWRTCIERIDSTWSPTNPISLGSRRRTDHFFRQNPMGAPY